MKDDPIIVTWNGDAFVPGRGYWAGKCNERFAVGHRYAFEEVLERSSNTHRHYFAAVHEGWKNLPEIWAQEFKTSEHLRKHCLIKAGFCDMQVLLCDTEDDALRFATFMQASAGYDVVVATDFTVTRCTAHSQSYRAMKKDEFQRSKVAVLDLIAEMIGTSRDALEANAEAAA